ncbi:DUF1800 domain-containing protein [Oryzicola mucosus]|uniref:DUF1800 domain-containing protein n=1 Tax=Oryzicola mucosus TaxID=2767425 RepID=A0A8J6PSZ4_9HYPH|nr:DUF1800 domain-containing protein [Oryzicola mucosus]MBD0413213.1 DUF1800 domain-containing protein [Oryzicola mucosus]
MTTAASQAERLTVAMNRFGLGAKPGDAIPTDAERWLIDQFDRYEPTPPAFERALPGADIADQFSEGRMALRGGDATAKMAARKELRQNGQALYRDEVQMRAHSALDTDTPFVERLVHFWSNHFAVSADKLPVTVLAGACEREAIRPNVLGNFEDMLLAVVRHPAMQLFLDQIRSVGPNSPMAQNSGERRNRRKPGINENLAREIMELHTLGVRTGYTQADVTQFALALTGWNVRGLGAGANAERPGGFAYRPRLHEPGQRDILGKSYADTGEEQAGAVLHDLATHDATAAHIATKLARHFIADEPPAATIRTLAAAYTSSGGDLKAVYAALVAMPEAWAAQPVKFKSPWEWTISSLRGLGFERPDMPIAPLLNQLGQPVWRPGSPAGYDDAAASWAAPDALVRRVEAAQRIVGKAPVELDARQLAPELLPGTLSDLTRREIGRAESGPTALALLLVSPDFQRR